MHVFLAFSAWNEPITAAAYLRVWVAIPLCGLTGIESLICAATGTSTVGYRPNPEYQRQSGLNNISVAVAAVLAGAGGWGAAADGALLTVTGVFFLLSGVNHAWSSLREANRSGKNLMRPIGAMALAGLLVPFIVRIFR